jgi:hypothetical protein
LLASSTTQDVYSNIGIFGNIVQTTSAIGGQPFISRNTTATRVSQLHNEVDGGGSQLQNLSSPGINEMYVGTNSDGGNNALEDFVEIYAKTTVAQSGGDAAGTGTRVFITPGSNGGFGINVGNAKAWGDDGVDKCDNRLTSAGLHVMGDIWSTGIEHDGDSSHTITHRTNVVGFEPEQIGTFAESTGELADVYGADYVPTLDRATDAIVKVRHSTSLNAKVLGIIIDDHTFANLGDMLCRVINTEDWSIVYDVGEILVPDIQGLCRKATHTERKVAAYHQIHLPRITALFPECEFVAAFIG